MFLICKLEMQVQMSPPTVTHPQNLRLLSSPTPEVLELSFKIRLSLPRFWELNEFMERQRRKTYNVICSDSIL